MLLKDKVALITGGGRGIGKEIALSFAREGANIAVCDISDELLAQLQQEIEALGRETLALNVDISDFARTEKLVNKVLDKFQKIDILVNNVGITRDSFIMRMSENDWDRVLAVNLKGTFNTTRLISRVMLKQRAGRIVNIASIIGIIGNAGQANYAASKAGIIGLTKSTARELASRGITVNAIAPGFIQTDMTEKLPQEIRKQMLSQIPLQKFGETMDVANTALFLVSDAARYITGQVIVVDGGMVM